MSQLLLGTAAALRRGQLCWWGLVISGLACAAASGQIPVDNPRSWLPDVPPGQLASLSTAAELVPDNPVVEVIARRLARIQPSSLYAVDHQPFPWHDPTTATPYQIYELRGSLTQADRYATSVSAEGGPPTIEYWLADLAAPAGPCQLLGLDGFTPLLAASAGNRHASAAAIYLTTLHRGEDRIPLFATRRIAWHPDVPDPGVARGAAALGAEGVDLGLLLEAPARNGRNLDHEDTLVVLQVLAHVDAALQRLPPPLPPLDVVALLREPRQHTGEAVAVTGTLERATAIDLRSNRLARRWGLTHYYQLDLHVPLGDRRLNVQGGKSGERLSFADSYPITVLVRDLPAGIQPGGRQQVQVEFPAFVYRMWSFASVKSQRIDPALRQVVPILIASRLQVLAPSAASFSRMTAGLVVVGSLGLLALAWWFGRSAGGRSANRGESPPDFANLAIPPPAVPPGENHEKT